MPNDFEFGFSKNHMIFSACKDCQCFRAFCFDSNNGYACSRGSVGDYFIPFDYPLADKEQKKNMILKYQKNDLPNGSEKDSDPCVFHTQCAMLNVMEDEDAIDEILANEYEAIEQKASKIDFSDPMFEHIAKLDPNFKEWCKKTKNATVAMLKKDGKTCGCVCLDVEKNEDYSWILPAPPTKHYFQKDETRLGITKFVVDDTIPNAMRLLIALAYKRAVVENVDEIYAVVGSSAMEKFALNGFHGIGYKYGGSGADDDDAEGAYVVVKKLKDLLEGE